MKSDPPATPAELTESSLQSAHENAELHGAIDVLLKKALNSCAAGLRLWLALLKWHMP